MVTFSSSLAIATTCAVVSPADVSVIVMRFLYK